MFYLNFLRYYKLNRDVIKKRKMHCQKVNLKTFYENQYEQR